MPSYEILYAITAHESPSAVQDLIKNILYYNHKLTVGIIINACPTLYDKIASLADDRVHIMRAPVPRNMWTFDILNGYLLAYEYCVTHDIVADYVVLLTSNCMFWKDVTSEYIVEQIGKKTTHDFSVPNHHHGWHWHNIYANHQIISILESNGMLNLRVNQHEGVIIEYDVFGKITQFIRETQLEHKIQRETVFEEFLLATLYTHFTGKDIGGLCKVFWDKPSYTPSISDILSCAEPSVKRISREYDAPLRKWLRDRANNYNRE